MMPSQRRYAPVSGRRHKRWIPATRPLLVLTLLASLLSVPRSTPALSASSSRKAESNVGAPRTNAHASLSGAHSKSFAAVADSYVNPRYPIANYGNLSRLRTDGTPIVSTYLRFSLKLPAGAVLSKAVLRLFASTSSSPTGFSVKDVEDNSWGEASINYRSAPAVGPELASSSRWSSIGYKSVALPPAAVRTGASSFAVQTSGSASIFFRSRESTTGRPQLVVTYSLPSLVPASGAYFGAYPRGDTTEGGWTQQQALDFEELIGRKIAIDLHYWAWADPNWPSPEAEGWDIAGGRIPMTSWNDGGWNNSTNIIEAINSGSQDTIIRAAADRVRGFGASFFLRPFWEMNGDWMGYNASFYGNDPTKFVAAWRRIHEIFSTSGATNAVWVWSPNCEDRPSGPGYEWNHWTKYYPGDSYVDWVACDGYNRYYTSWKSFATLFTPVYNDFPGKPFMAAELGSVEDPATPGRKADWIREAKAYVEASMPRFKAWVWFHRFPRSNGSMDWRVNTSTSSLETYVSIGADPYFNP